MSRLQETVKHLLEALHNMSPAYNELVQMIFILPQRARALTRMYPELVENNEEELLELFSLRYTDKCFIEAYSSRNPLGLYIAGLYRALFKTLADPDRRRRLLKLANISESEFKEIDPLRAWIEVSLEYLAKVNKDVLKLLDFIVAKLSGKGPSEYLSLDEVKKSATDIKGFENLMGTLRHFLLLPYEYDSSVYVRECPLLLEAYSDLRAKLQELSR